jgi:hypothetical protein
MKRILYFFMGIASLMVLQPQLSAKAEFINITALHCNPEAIRNKVLLEQCIDAIAAEYEWSATPYTSTLHNEAGLVIPLYTDHGTITLQCINRSNAVLISIIKLKGKITLAELKKIIRTYLETTNIKIQVQA